MHPTAEARKPLQQAPLDHLDPLDWPVVYPYHQMAFISPIPNSNAQALLTVSLRELLIFLPFLYLLKSQYPSMVASQLWESSHHVSVIATRSLFSKCTNSPYLFPMLCMLVQRHFSWVFKCITFLEEGLPTNLWDKSEVFSYCFLKRQFPGSSLSLSIIPPSPISPSLKPW